MEKSEKKLTPKQQAFVEIFVKENKKTGWQIYYKFRGGLDGRLPQSIWINSEFSASDYGTKILDNILEDSKADRIIKLVTYILMITCITLSIPLFNFPVFA